MATASSSTTLPDAQCFTFSASSLQDYADCPRRFRLRYLDQLLWPAVDAEPISEVETRQREALLFHRLAQQQILGLPADRLAAIAASPDLERWWRNFVSADLGLTGMTLQTEKTLASSVGSHRLVAKYDLLAFRPGKAVIYDWKTYARRPRDEWMAARWQTRVYRAMLVKAGAALNAGQVFEPTDVSMVYWFSEFPFEPAVFSYGAGEFARDWSAIETLVNEICVERAFPLTENRGHCRFCEFRSLCDRGEKAGAWQDGEAESQEAAAFDLDFEQIGEIEF